MSTPTPSPPHSRARSRLATVSVLLSVLLVAAAAQCRPATGPTVTEYRAKSETLKKADAEKVLRIGVQEDLPFMSERDKGTGRWTGFDVELARLIAYDLGFTRPDSYQFVPLTTEKRISALQGGDVHIVVADFTITPDRLELIRFAGPYLLATPEVLIRKEDQAKIKTIDDLKTIKVCSTGGSTTDKMLTRYGIPHSLLARGADCVEGVRDRTFDAHSTDDVVLAGFVERSKGEFAMVDMPFSDTEPLGVGLPFNDPYLEGLVAHYLRKQAALGQQSQWQAAYNSTLAAVLGPKSQPPLLPHYPQLADHDDKALGEKGIVTGRAVTTGGRRRRARR